MQNRARKQNLFTSEIKLQASTPFDFELCKSDKELSKKLSSSDSNPFSIFRSDNIYTAEVVSESSSVPFKIIKQYNNSFIFSDDLKFINDTIKALIQYSHNVSPDSVIHKRNIIHTPEHFQKELGLPHYAICGNDYIPAWINAHININDPLWKTNCFSYGRFMSGQSPMPAEDFWIGDQAAVCIPIASHNDLSQGDYVEIRGSHGFTYISPFICLSANGKNKPAQFHSLKKVLKIYDAPKDSLAKPTKGIDVYRKPSDFNYPHELRQIIFDIASYVGLINTPKFGQKLELLCKFMMTDKSIYAQQIWTNVFNRKKSNFDAFLGYLGIGQRLIALSHQYARPVTEEAPSLKLS